MKTLLIFSLLLFSTFAFSQDMITLSDGRVVKAKILELTPDLVKYKKFDNIDGPTYTVPTSDLLKIKYANGSEDTFTASSKSNSNVDTENIPSVLKGKFDINDSETASFVEAVAKNAGAKVLERCVGSCINSYTEIFWADVFRDDSSMELHIPIKVKWDKRTTDKSRWIRGEIIFDKEGKRKWKHQNDSGSVGGCSKGLLEL